MGTEREKAARRIPDYSPRVGVYARVSTNDQTPENQPVPLRSFAAARGWTVTEYVDHGVSGAKERRPALVAKELEALSVGLLSLSTLRWCPRGDSNTRHAV